MIRDIKIKAVLNGYIVEVGCTSVVFDSIGKLIGALEGYLKDPEGIEKAYLDTSLNAKHLPLRLVGVAVNERVGQIPARANFEVGKSAPPSSPPAEPCKNP